MLHFKRLAVFGKADFKLPQTMYRELLLIVQSLSSFQVLTLAKIKLPEEADAIGRISISRSLLKKTSNFPVNNTLSPINTIIGPAIQNPHAMIAWAT
jgi:hypothetical protein